MEGFTKRIFWKSERDTPLFSRMGASRIISGALAERAV